MIIYGKQPVFYALNRHSERILEFYVAKELPRDVFAKIAMLNKPIKRLDSKKAQALAHNGNHQGIFAKIIPPQPSSLEDLKRKDSLLVLCDISDVGNIASIARTAYALGVGGMIISLSSFAKSAPKNTKNFATNPTKVNEKNLSEKMLEGLIRLSSGAFLDMPFMLKREVLDICNELKYANFSLFGADLQGGIHAPSANGKWALFLGSESQGLSARLKLKLDTILSIDMHREFDSLNVSVAAGILIDRIQYATR